MNKKIIIEMDHLLKNFAEEKAKEIEQALGYAIEEQTEIKDNKIVWTAAIKTHIQSIQEHLSNVENKVLHLVDKYEIHDISGELQIKDWYLFKGELKAIFEKRRLP